MNYIFMLLFQWNSGDLPSYLWLNLLSLCDSSIRARLLFFHDPHLGSTELKWMIQLSRQGFCFICNIAAYIPGYTKLMELSCQKKGSFKLLDSLQNCIHSLNMNTYDSSFKTKIKVFLKVPDSLQTCNH